MDTITNIIPNPLIKNAINIKYSNSFYATSDFNGEKNTTYFRLESSDENISKVIHESYYIPGIGELGLAMENIQAINNAITYAYTYFGVDTLNIGNDINIVSSTIRTENNNSFSKYTQLDNITNVWYFNTTYAKITYGNVNNKYTVLPFYKYVINDEEILNSLIQE